jgi:hypothetical protein
MIKFIYTTPTIENSAIYTHLDIANRLSLKNQCFILPNFQVNVIVALRG